MSSLVVAAHFSDECTHGEVRLVNGSSEYNGRLEVCNDGVWGTVTSDAWSHYESRVVCRQLGYSGLCQYTLLIHEFFLVFVCVCVLNVVASPFFSSFPSLSFFSFLSLCFFTFFIFLFLDALHYDSSIFGSNYDIPIVMDRVFCGGFEENLFNCTFNSVPTSTDTHAKDIGIQCYSKEGISVNENRVSIFCHPSQIKFKMCHLFCPLLCVCVCVCVCLFFGLKKLWREVLACVVFLLSLFFAFSFLFQPVTVLPGMLDLSMVALSTREPSRFVSVESGVLSVILTGVRMMEELYADNWDTQQQVKRILGCMKMTTIEH